jgi:hypothetical protein
MVGESYDLSAQFFNIVKDELASIGKSLSSSEESELRIFLSRGLRIIEQRDSYSYITEVENRLRAKVRSVASPNMSLRDILKKLCPMDPFC